MQLTRHIGRAALALGLCVAWNSPCAAADDPEEPKGGPMLRLFSDSDKVGVRSLMGDYAFDLPGKAELALHWNNERVSIPAIDAPVGSQEAIDAITTASRPIAGNAYQDFVKIRNEFQGGVSRGGKALEYYLSSERDYLAQQVAARMGRDFMNQQLNVSMGTSYGWDAIDPVADDDTNTGADAKTTLHWNAVATQILTPATVVRVGLEYNLLNGLQHNPYRNVYAGGGYVAERHPDQRHRRDAFVKLNQYLQNRSSVKLSYRFYSDDWGIASHELGTKLSQYVVPAVFARWQYRYYTQTSADFYSESYASASGIGGYRSGDYRMGTLSSHLFGAALNLDFDALEACPPALRRMGLWLSYERYFNSNNYSANILETGLDLRF